MADNDGDRPGRLGPLALAVVIFTFALGLIQAWSAIMLGFGGWPEWLSLWVFVSGWALSGGNALWFLVCWIIVSRQVKGNRRD